MTSAASVPIPYINFGSTPWIALYAIAFLAFIFIAILPFYTVLLAGITILRARRRIRGSSCRSSDGSDGTNQDKAAHLPPWQNIRTSIFQGSVFHIRHQPVIHSFKYPLYFSVVDLDEASELFGEDHVRPCGRLERQQHEQNEINSGEYSSGKGILWPLSTLMQLRDKDHLKNGEGLGTNDTKGLPPRTHANKSMKERIFELVCERTNGKLDLRSKKNTAKFDEKKDGMEASEKRKVVLVTHLQYYGYCFNPVSLYFILKPKDNHDEEETIEAIVVEVSNTPWNEMSIYVLHPDSVDILESNIHSSAPTFSNDTENNETKSKSNTHHYIWKKNFHVSPFMTMDHLYDWKFQLSRNCIVVEAKMIKQPEPSSHNKEASASNDTNDTKNNSNKEKGTLFFTAGFNIQRTIQPSSSSGFSLPLHMARIIYRFPVYCFIIQVWIHYEAIKLLIKGVQFIPHPEGSETGASKVIAAVMGPVFRVLEVLDVGLSRLRGGNGNSASKIKSA